VELVNVGAFVDLILVDLLAVLRLSPYPYMEMLLTDV